MEKGVLGNGVLAPPSGGLFCVAQGGFRASQQVLGVPLWHPCPTSQHPAFSLSYFIAALHIVAEAPSASLPSLSSRPMLVAPSSQGQSSRPAGSTPQTCWVSIVAMQPPPLRFSAVVGKKWLWEHWKERVDASGGVNGFYTSTFILFNMGPSWRALGSRFP